MTRLEELPARVDDLTGQILQLRAEMGSECFAVREQIAGLTTRFEGLTARFDGLTTRFDGLTARFDGLTARVEGLTGQVDGLTTRFDGMPGQIVRDVMTQVRILHEDVIDRLKIIQEGQASKPRPGDRKKR